MAWRWASRRNYGSGVSNMRLVGKDKEARMGGSWAVSSLDLLAGRVRVSEEPEGSWKGAVECRVSGVIT